MNIREHIQFLRSQLLAMSRLSQRAVDYSIKALELKSKEFCHQVHDCKEELRDLHCSIARRCCALLITGLPSESDLRFALSAFRMSGALQSIYSAAVEIAQHTMHSLEDGDSSESCALEEMGQIVNRLTRLCTVALFQEEAHHVKTVLSSNAAVRWFDMAVFAHKQRNCISPFELAITKSFGQMARQTREMACAIMLWLEGHDCSGSTHRNDLRTVYDQTL